LSGASVEIIAVMQENYAVVEKQEKGRAGSRLDSFAVNHHLIQRPAGIIMKNVAKRQTEMWSAAL